MRMPIRKIYMTFRLEGLSMSDGLLKVGMTVQVLTYGSELASIVKNFSNRILFRCVMNALIMGSGIR
jgi:hypothetical protein